MFKFQPILKSTLWGGEKIIPFKHLDSNLHQVGESWEISGVEGKETIISEGEYSGLRLNELVALMRDRLLGADNYLKFGNEFPLLIKFIDACQDLSIQVHPDDETALSQGKERGKTEMWYTLPSSPDAQIFNGLKKDITPEQYKQMVSDGTIIDALASYTVKEGDVFFIPAGRIHSICKGCFITESQQTSDVTYRIYDYHRQDKDGHYRQLHTKEASESINYQVLSDQRTNYTLQKNTGVEVVRCPYFTTAIYEVDEPMTIDYSELDSFVILICVKGSGTLSDDSGDTTTFEAGETILLPATTREVSVSGQLRFLETYI